MYPMLANLACSEHITKVMSSLLCCDFNYFEFGEDGSCTMHKLLLLHNHANDNSIT